MDPRGMENYFSLAVLMSNVFLQVDGQCTPATRPLQINATFNPQYISSPNYPNEYPLDQDCAWIIKAPSTYDKLIINLEEVGAEGSSLPCKYDYVAVYDGEDTSATELARLCNINMDDQNALVSSTDTLYVIFVSDWAFNYVGFNMLIFSNDTDYQPDCDQNTTLIATTTPQVIMSPNLPSVYESNSSCIIQFYPETTYFAVSFELLFLDLESTSGCTNDVLRFSSVGEISTVEEAAECSTALTYEFANFPLEVSGTYVEVNFTTDPSVDNYLGFMLLYSQVFKGINLTSPENEGMIEYVVPEDLPTGHVNESVCVIVLTYTGTLSFNITHEYEQTTDQNVSLADTQIFDLTDSPPYLYLDLVSSLDYEIISKFSLVVKMVDSDVTQVTYTVTFNITITDIDDVAPTFGNLPGNYTVTRGQKSGELLYTVNATDTDGTPENRVILFQIYFGDTDSMFEINETSGEVRLAQDANVIPLTTLEYDLTIAAYSGSFRSGVGSFSSLTLYVSPDSPPVCSHDTVWGETVDVNLAGAETQVQLLDRWNCSDDNVNLTYTILSVSPNLTTTLFDIDANGVVTFLREFNISEVVNRQFMLEIGVTDSVDQTVTFDMYMNVTALTCLPNPRNLYVRMDQEIDEVILNGFNCTHKYGLNYILKQYPAGTFEVNSAVNGTALLILKAPVLKIKFYSLTITITDGVDIAVLRFKVIVRTRRCGIASTASVPRRTLSLMFLSILYSTAFSVLLVV